jgi:hypothetical protein
MEVNCQAGLSAKATPTQNNDRTSPVSTATTDNYPSDDHLGKRNLSQRGPVMDDANEPANKRPKQNNAHCPLEID